MARKPKKAEGGSLDSLLDTMTNVVGILVIVLIVTQLNVAEALKRIESNLPQVSVEDVERVRALADENRQTRQKLETTWTKLEPEESKEKVIMDQLKLEVDEIKKENEDVVKKSSDLEDLKKLVAEHKEKVEVTGTAVLAADEELQKLKAMLDETPEREILAPKIVNLPNPRPAPQNAEPRFVLCKGNKAYFVGDVYTHLFKVRSFIEENFVDFVYRGPGFGSHLYSLQLNRKSETGSYLPVQNRDDRTYQKFRFDGARIQKYFEANEVGGEDLVYRVVKASDTADYLALRIMPRPEGGMTVDDFKKRSSPLDNAFKQVGINRNYLIFMVAPDSFDAYLEARQMAEFHRIPAGWQPWTVDLFTPSTKVPRETMEISFDDLPLTDIAAVSKALAPVTANNVKTAEAKAAAVTDADQKIEAEKFVKSFVGYESAVKTVPEIAEKMRGREEVRLYPNAPNIPLIRIFAIAGEIPKGGPKPVVAAPKQPKTAPPAPKRDVLD